MSLMACRACRRHGRSTEASCPFCGTRRLIARAGVITFAALGVAWTDGGADASSEAAAPATQGVTDTPDAGVLYREDDGMRGVVPIYGTPPHRSGC